MKIVKWVLIVVGSVVALVLVAALFVKKEYEIEREMVINQNKQTVYDYIKYLKNQDNYSKWNMADPLSKKEYTGTDGTEGFTASWDSKDKNVGKGEQTITKLIEGERMELALHFIKPFEGRAQSYMQLESVSDNQTKVKWGFKSAMPYPMNIMRVFMNMEKMLGDDMLIGLENLKKVLEK